MQYQKAQYNNGYQKKNYNNSSDNTGGQAKIKSTKKDGVILEIILNNQNLVLKGFETFSEKFRKLFKTSFSKF